MQAVGEPNEFYATCIAIVSRRVYHERVLEDYSLVKRGQELYEIW